MRRAYPCVGAAVKRTRVGAPVSDAGAGDLKSRRRVPARHARDEGCELLVGQMLPPIRNWRHAHFGRPRLQRQPTGAQLMRNDEAEFAPAPTVQATALAAFGPPILIQASLDRRRVYLPRLP